MHRSTQKLKSLSLFLYMVKVCKALTAVNEAEVSPPQITLNPFAVQGIFKLTGCPHQV